MKEMICGIIVTYNCDSNFVDTLNSVINQVDKLIIVDNGSSEDTIKMLKNLNEKYHFKLYCCNKNIGIAAALNIGVKYSIDNGYEWILTLDHDSVLKQDMVEKLLKRYHELHNEERKKVVSLLPRYILEGIEDKNISNEKVRYVEAGITSGNFVKKEAFEQVGLFEEKLFIDYVDYDFCYRIIEKGLKIVEVSDAIMYHKLGEISSKNLLNAKFNVTNHNPIRRYYMTINRFYCWNKYKDIVSENIKYDKMCAAKETVKILLFEEDKFEKMKMKIKGVHDYKKDKYGKI